MKKIIGLGLIAYAVMNFSGKATEGGLIPGSGTTPTTPDYGSRINPEQFETI